VEKSREKSFMPLPLGHNISFIGASNCGKSTTIGKFILERNYLFSHQITHIYYFFSVWQDIFTELESTLKEKITFIEGFPSKEDLENYEKESILILDDILGGEMDNPNLLYLVTVLTHHRSYITMLVLHNMFPRGKNSKSISLNCQFFVLFNAKRDMSQISVFAKQAFPKQYNFFMSAYFQATNKTYGYLLVDLSMTTEKKYALRTSIFKDDDMVIYLPDGH
jgi:hypothetical protein